jgi:ABC-type molybdenum transport system ATPase subunit/photorepair protein PhrA
MFFARCPITYGNRDAMVSGGESRPYLDSVTLAGYAGLGGSVSMRLAPRRTVLVGRNGAGKSLLLEGLNYAAEAAVFRRSPAPRRRSPSIFECVIVGADGERVGYRYEERSDSKPIDDDEDHPNAWYERCWRINTPENFWTVDNGVLSLPHSEPVVLGPSVGFLAIRQRDQEGTELPTPPEFELVRNLLASLQLVGSGNVRGDAQFSRDSIFLMARMVEDRRRWQVRTPRNRIGRLAAQIANMYESRPEDFREFETLMNTLGLTRKIKLAVYENEPSEATSPREAIGIPIFDDVDMGRLSDGTLRVAEIVLRLIGSSSVLLIEEPELAVHPGLLERLLNVVDSYSIDRQIVVSSHSPQVVSWCRPDEVRFVRRQESVTSVHELKAEQVKRVCAFLCNDGTLGDFVFTSDEND